MGFEVGGNTAVLEFAEGTLLAGATVRVSLDMRVNDFLALQRRLNKVSPGADLDEDAFAAWEDVAKEFATRALKSWDLTDGGVPIPATVDGFMSLPFSVAQALLNAWVKAMAGPSPNSNAASGNGAEPAAAKTENRQS